MKDCLVVGGDSQIGRSLRANLRASGHSVAWTSRRKEGQEASFLDLYSLDGIDDLPKAKFVALVAAETKFDVCSDNPGCTHRINVDAPVALARRALEWGAKVLFFSSIAVHDGSHDNPAEDIRPSPNTEYGKQKLEAEDLLLAQDTSIAILRPTKVITPDFGLFCDWSDKLLRGENIAPFKEMITAPISLDLLVSVSANLLVRKSASGIYQLSASDQVSYAEIGFLLAEALGVSPKRVAPVSARNQRAVRWLPKYARLGCARLERELGILPPPSRSAISYFVQSYRSRDN